MFEYSNGTFSEYKVTSNNTWNANTIVTFKEKENGFWSDIL